MAEDPLHGLANDLRAVDDIFYVFQPEDDQTDHFIGEAFLLLVGGILMQGFIRGLTDELKPELGRLGSALGAWIATRIGRLFTKEHDSKLEDLETLDANETIRQLRTQVSAQDFDKAVVITRMKIVAAFTRHGAGEAESEAVVGYVERTVLQGTN